MHSSLLHLGVSVGGAVRQLSPEEVAELRVANARRRAALSLIQRSWRPKLRRWLRRTRKLLEIPHSFAAANEVIGQMQEDLQPLRARVRRDEATRIQKARDLP